MVISSTATLPATSSAGQRKYLVERIKAAEAKAERAMRDFESDNKPPKAVAKARLVIKKWEDHEYGVLQERKEVLREAIAENKRHLFEALHFKPPEVALLAVKEFEKWLANLKK